MLENEKQLNNEELEQVSGGWHMDGIYKDVIDETEDDYVCKICGRRFDLEDYYFIDAVNHLKRVHGIDRSTVSTIPNPIHNV